MTNCDIGAAGQLGSQSVLVVSTCNAVRYPPWTTRGEICGAEPVSASAMCLILAAWTYTCREGSIMRTFETQIQ